MVPEKDADDHLKSSPSDINTNAINMSQTHNSVQHGSMKDIETQVEKDLREKSHWLLRKVLMTT